MSRNQGNTRRLVGGVLPDVLRRMRQAYLEDLVEPSALTERFGFSLTVFCELFGPRDQKGSYRKAKALGPKLSLKGVVKNEKLD